MILGCFALLSPAAGYAQQATSPPKDTTAPAAAASPLAFTGVTVIDVRDGRLLRNQTVMIVGNRVQAVDSARAVQLPRDVRVVDARGKYLIPGLWDMHVHIWNAPQMYSSFVANGVTGIREMSQALPIDSMFTWRREIATGVRVGPRVVGTGGFLISESENNPLSRNQDDKLMIWLDTPDDARRAVDSLKAAGADFVKIRDGLTREVYFAIAAESRRTGMPLVGHLSHWVTPAEASDSGQHSVEHLNEFHDHISQRPDACWAADSAGEGCSAVAATFARNGTWFVPTLDMFYHGRSSLRGGCNEPESIKCLEATMGKMYRAGMPMMAGSDTSPGDIEVPPGRSLHEELTFFVRVGLTPLEALQTATLNPAKFFHATDSLGTVAAGQLADLVLLDADPLVDIHNTTKIRAVVVNGRYFDRSALDRLLQ